jgi:hypothetical protein
LKFSILHTSARPDKWRAVFDAWHKKADNPRDVEYVLVCDRRWGFDRLPNFDAMDFPAFPNARAVWNTGRKCYVDGVNIAAQYGTGDVFIVNADDQFPCEHWDTKLTKAMDHGCAFQNDGGNFVVEVSTNTTAEHERGILVMPILSRARYEKYGYVLYPAYESMYSDNDFCEMAKRDGAIIDARHLVFPHKHPVFDQAQAWDKAYEQQNRKEAYALGQAVLEKRRESNFGDVKVVERAAAPVLRSILLVLPGEMFNQAWVKALVEIIDNLSPFFRVNTQWLHCSNVYFTRKAMLDAAKTWAHRPDYILWIDDDQILTVDALRLLMRDLEDNPELAAVVGWAWCESNIYSSAPMLSCGGLDTAGKVKRFEYAQFEASETDLIPITYSGFPAVLMRGSILDTMTGDDFLPILDAQEFPPYGMSGEDVAFFYRGREKGLKFAVDRRVKVPHLKLRCAEPVMATSLEGAPVSK